ncbi:MAG: hypothetical protein AAGJ70_02220 [Pseudomonadota bacterium]
MFGRILEWFRPARPQSTPLDQQTLGATDARQQSFQQDGRNAQASVAPEKDEPTDIIHPASVDAPPHPELADGEPHAEHYDRFDHNRYTADDVPPSRRN